MVQAVEHNDMSDENVMIRGGAARPGVMVGKRARGMEGQRGKDALRGVRGGKQYGTPDLLSETVSPCVH